MKCTKCNKVLEITDFYNSDKCYKCVYKYKVENQVRCCQICHKKLKSSRWAYCSDPCAKKGNKLKQKQSWISNINAPKRHWKVYSFNGMKDMLNNYNMR